MTPEPTPNPAPDALPAKEKRPGSRPLWIVVLALLLGAAALWGASRLAFVELTGPAGGSTLSGAETEGWHTPHALLALTAVAAALAVSGWPRRLLGLLLLAVACWQVYATLDGVVFNSGGWVAYAPIEGSTAGTAFAGPALALAGALLIAFAGSLLLLRGHHMPRLGAKYSAPGAKKTAKDPDAQLWDALSEGDDPTRGR